MAKQFDPSRFPTPPKPSFPVEIMPPGNTGFGGGSGSFGGGDDFRAAFLKFMREAGEALGKAAGAEIEKVKLQVEGGEQKPQGEPLSGKITAKQPGQGFALQQFARAANLPDFTKLAGMLSGPLIAGKLAGLVLNAPSNATELSESQRRFANVSPSMATAFIESDVKKQLRDLKSGENLAPSNRELLRELDKFRNSAAQWTDLFTEIKNVLGTGILEGINSIVGPVTELALGKRSTPERLPWVERLKDMRGARGLETPDERMARWRREGIAPLDPQPGGRNPNAPAGPKP